MEWAQSYTRHIDWETYESSLVGLRTSNGFMEEVEIEMSGNKLVMPPVTRRPSTDVQSPQASGR